MSSVDDFKDLFPDDQRTESPAGKRAVEATELLKIPERADEAGKVGVLAGVSRDVSLEYSKNESSSQSQIAAVFNRIETPLFAVGLHGSLPPGTRALVVPTEFAFELDGGPIPGNGYADLSTWQANPNLGAGVGFVSAREKIPDHMVVLYPGDVHSFDEILTKGVTVLVSAPMTTIAQVENNFGPVVDALLRVYTSPEFVPSKLSYRPIAAATFLASVATGDPVGFDPGPFNESLDFAVLVNGATHVKVVLGDNTEPFAPIVGGESADMEVWWLDASGIWLHHHADDFDAAGKGQATTEHFVEQYAVNKGMLAVYVKREGAGDNFYHTIVATDEWAGR